MTRPIHKLTARQVETVKKAGRYGDGAGLYLRVTSTGAKRWVYRYTRSKGTSPREMGLGSAGKGGVSLADARSLAAKAKQVLLNGGDPISSKALVQGDHKSGVPKFGPFADDFVEQQSANFRNDKHIAQWKMTLQVYAAPIRDLPLDQIKTEDILGILQPIWQTKSETAHRLRGRIERVLNAAKARGYRSGENPAAWRGHLELLLPKRPRLQRGHFAAMDYRLLPDFVARLRERGGMAALALEFTIHASARSGEVRHMEWTDLDLDDQVWTVPAERMKAGRIHKVPLTPRMIDIIETVRPFSSDSQFVFPTRNGKTPLSDAALSSVLKRMNVDNATVHGFRSSFRDWAGDATDHPREVAETALAHVVGDATERAYRRGDAFAKRRLLMTEWNSYLNKRD